MLRVLLLRHAEAVAHATSSDILRPLTAAGRIGAARIGQYLANAKLAPELALFSPAFRARETLDIVERQIPHRMVRCSEPSLYNGNVNAIDCALAKTATAIKTVLIVAHNPALGEFANARANDGDAEDLAHLRKHFPAPCLAVIHFVCDDWSEAGSSPGWLDRFVTLANLPD